MIKDNPEKYGYEFVSKTTAKKNSGSILMDLLSQIYDFHKNDLFGKKFVDLYDIATDYSHVVDGNHFFISIALDKKIIVEYFVIQKQEVVENNASYQNYLYKKTKDKDKEEKFIFYAKLLK